MGLISMRESPETLAGATGEGENVMAKRTGLSVAPAAYSILVMGLIMIITVAVLVQPTNANPTCILNCAQCVKIYGDYFDGHSCAKVCMESRSRFDSFVDCADPTTIARFLKSY